MVQSVIRKSGCRFPEKIMLKQRAKATYRFNLKNVSLECDDYSLRTTLA